MIFFIDFDDTLFDTANFKKFLEETAAVAGVSSQDFWLSYREAREDGKGDLCYSPERQARILSGRGYGLEEIRRALSGMAKENIHRFVAEGAGDFLDGLKTRGHELILLSLGDEDFQRLKVEGSGLSGYFGKIFFKRTGKEKVIGEILKNGEAAWFINDKIKENEMVARLYPSIKIAVRVPAGADGNIYREGGWPYFKTLKEILDYVRQSI